MKGGGRGGAIGGLAFCSLDDRSALSTMVIVRIKGGRGEGEREGRTRERRETETDRECAAKLRPFPRLRPLQVMDRLADCQSGKSSRQMWMRE